MTSFHRDVLHFRQNRGAAPDREQRKQGKDIDQLDDLAHAASFSLRGRCTQMASGATATKVTSNET